MKRCQTANGAPAQRPASNPAATITPDARQYSRTRLDEHVHRVVASFPPLTADQRSRLSVLLGAHTGTGVGGAA